MKVISDFEIRIKDLKETSLGIDSLGCLECKLGGYSWSYFPSCSGSYSSGSPLSCSPGNPRSYPLDNLVSDLRDDLGGHSLYHLGGHPLDSTLN